MKPGAWIAIAAVSGFLSVALGAFGAHGLSGRLSDKALSVYHTAAQYQMYHALALLGLGVWMAASPAVADSSLAQWAGAGLALGTVLFSGSLYALALTDVKILGAITPFGGLAFLGSWASLAILALRSARG